ncbi:MAG: polyamine aminopropyltransferase [Magnetococcales bacterium]|nr:polyamine aminopropyltransferase [Magnetococcales bacterium]
MSHSQATSQTDPSGTFRFATILLALSMFFTGASGLVAEFLLATVSTYILGSSIEQFSITFGVMLGFMGVGGWVQKFFSDSRLIEKFILLEILLAWLTGFAPLAIYTAFGLLEDHFLLVQYFFIMGIGFLIGFEIPFVIRINEKYARTLKSNLAVVTAADYLGAFVFTFVWVYWFLGRFPLTEIGFLVAGINFFVAIITALYFAKQRLVSLKWSLLILILGTAASLLFGYHHNRAWNLDLEQRLYEDRIVLAETTPYQRLVLTHRKRLDEYRFYINGNLQFSSLDEVRYHELLVHPVMALVESPKRVLVLGGGDGLAVRELLKYTRIEAITLVELDPRMVQLFSTHPLLTRLNQEAFRDARVRVEETPGIESDGVKGIYQETGRVDPKTQLAETRWVAGVEVIHIDADLFLNTPSADQSPWDVVIIDFPDPSSVELAKLYSKEFYLKLRRVLAPQGMVAVQSTSPYHAKEVFLTIGRTLAAAGFQTLPYHANIPSFGEWGWHLAWIPGRLPDRISQPISQLQGWSVPTAFLTVELFRAATVFGKGELDSHSREVSTLMNPILLDDYLRAGWQME